MKLNRFRDRSLIMGVFLSTQSLQNWMKKNQRRDSSLSFLGNMILAALHFEGKSGRVGPSRLASSIGFSRSRVSQEISRLTVAGLIRRRLESSDARSFSIYLTPAGEQQAIDTVKVFSRLQTLVDRTIGEKEAETITMRLLELAGVLHRKLPSK